MSSDYFRKYPLVTVIVCTCDRPVQLRRALASVLAQTWTDLEVVCIHDGPPSEETKTVLNEYGDLFYNKGVDWLAPGTDEKSGYYCAPRNTAITHYTRGDYIMHLDDDNALTPTAVEALVTALREGVVWDDFTYGRLNYVFEEGARRIHKHRTLPFGISDIQPWDDMAKARLAAGPMTSFIDTSSFMASRGAYWRLGLATGMMFNESLRRFGDYELLTRAVFFAGWRGKAVDEVVVDYYWGSPNQIQLGRPAHEGATGEAV